LHGWNRSDILALVGVILAAVAIIIPIVPPLRHMVQDWWRGAMLRAGFPRRKYAKWFITEKWGIYENPYLGKKENLDLGNTYVPLSFRTGGAPDKLTLAADTLGDPETGNLIIDGGPGSGKSTLLKAYGVSVLQERSFLRRSEHLVPFLVQLRKLPRFLDDHPGKGVADYIIDETLVDQAGMSADQARHFLEYAVRHDQVVVMFDGLDEITEEHYQAVREALYRFKEGHNEDCPTSKARLLLTCRRQNFLAIREDWVSAFELSECSLAPLRNSEIFSYLDKHRKSFEKPNSPERLMTAVLASKILELHRTPLILAMSVGLYAPMPHPEIPSSIARLYTDMLREMLNRHNFPRDPGGAALRFKVDDKYRFLREFSLHAAEETGQFDDFTKADLLAFATQLAPHLDKVNDPAGMVDETIDRSGLLSDVSEATFVFAHRSIQEFLVAEQLRLKATAGQAYILQKATNHEWQQVAQFYSSGQEGSQIDDYLRELSKRNPDLAAYCLAGARPSNEVAKTVLDALEPINDMNLPALAAATRSPRDPVKQMAIDRLRTALTASGSTLTTANADVDGLLPLLNSLAGTNAAEIAGLVPQIVAGLPDDPRLVGPLWRCLAVPGVGQLSECRAIVQRLLGLVIDPNSFEELARQDRYDREFLTENRRRRAYPFKEGLDLRHNMVTLLSWAEYLNVTPSSPNRFFEAKISGRLDRIESDRRHTISFSPWRTARIASILAMALASVAAIGVLVLDSQQLLHPLGWWTPLVVLGVGELPIWLYVVPTAGIIDGVLENEQISYYFGASSGNASGNYFLGISRSYPFYVCSFALAPFAFAVSTAPLISASLTTYIITAITLQTAFWVLDIRMLSLGRRYYLYHPNAFVDIYDDPRSRHWLGVKAAGPTSPVGQQNP
jgi:hypothetical protein